MGLWNGLLKKLNRLSDLSSLLKGPKLLLLTVKIDPGTVQQSAESMTTNTKLCRWKNMFCSTQLQSA